MRLARLALKNLPAPAVVLGMRTRIMDGRARHDSGQQDGTPLAPVGPAVVRRSVLPAVQRGADQMWSVDDLGWAVLEAGRLTDLARSVVRYITYIEDHLPGYLDWLLRTFPATGAERDVAVFCANREYFRFFVAWAYDEERHASALTRYQLAAGISANQDALSLALPP